MSVNNLSKRAEIDLSSFWQSIHNHLDRSWINLSSHLSIHIHIQIALDLDRYEIDLTH